jgi:peptidoglycan hydrolase-like protein with peptidoglycan-binding domain
MKKFLVNEEEKNRILNLHKKLISEQLTQIGNTRVGAASKLGGTQLPTLPTVLRPTSTGQQFSYQEKEGEVSASFFEQNKIGDYSEDIATTETDPNNNTKPTWKETTLTIEDLKNGKSVSIGMKGPVITEIQKLLISAGYKDVSKSGNPDDLFGKRTKSSVEKFQSENKNDKGEPLKKDGIVGPETIKTLLKKSDEKMKSAAQGETPQKLRLADKDFGKIPTPPREQIPSINLPDRNTIQLPGNVPGVQTK